MPSLVIHRTTQSYEHSVVVVFHGSAHIFRANSHLLLFRASSLGTPPLKMLIGAMIRSLVGFTYRATSIFLRTCFRAFNLLLHFSKMIIPLRLHSPCCHLRPPAAHYSSALGVAHSGLAFDSASPVVSKSYANHLGGARTLNSAICSYYRAPSHPHHAHT